LKTKIKNEDGFIAIVALGIFLVITVFGLIIQSVTTDTVNSVKNTNKYYEASDIADSVMEYLQYELNQREAGYNLDIEQCVYGDFRAPSLPTPNGFGDIINDPNNLPPSDNAEQCDNILKQLGILDDSGNSAKNVKISMNIKGRSEPQEKFSGSCTTSMGDNGCYIVPFPGTGTAGDRCELYSPFSDPISAPITKDLVNSLGKIVTENEANDGDVQIKTISQIDYSCNWNKLMFGSSSTDRVTIPLYYQEEDGDVINVFKDVQGAEDNPPADKKAEQFVLRVRTPCKPCVPDANNSNVCKPEEDPTICSDSDRYKLNTQDGNDIVVQWQITGQCDDGNGGLKECGLIQKVNELDIRQSSDISERKINGEFGVEFPNKEVLIFNLVGLETDEYTDDIIIDFLSKMTKPSLTLFLGEKLKTPEGKNIPYLEYQLLTDNPVGDSKIKAYVEINVDGNIFKKTIYKQEQKPLIDFAVQN
jgi:hypothetical protein